VTPGSIGLIVNLKIWRHVADFPGDGPSPTPVEIAMAFVLSRLRSGEMRLVKQGTLYAEFRGAMSSGLRVFEKAIDALEQSGQVVVVRPGDDEGFYRAYWVGYLGVINLASLAFEW
jgi:hypothetical protein